MSKMGNLHFQAQEDARDGMDLKSYLEEYGDDSLSIWEEFNGCDEDEERMSQKTFICDDCGLKFNFEDISVNEVSICKLCNDDDDDEAKQKSFFGKSLEEQSDYEIQTEHWGSERA